MDLKLIQLDENVNEEIYDMLQDIPANENGLTNPMNGKTIDEVLLTIKKNNIASIKAAYANGGVLKEETDSLLYIWITC